MIWGDGYPPGTTLIYPVIVRAGSGQKGQQAGARPVRGTEVDKVRPKEFPLNVA